MRTLVKYLGIPEYRPLFHAMVDKLGLRDALVARPHRVAVVARAEARCAGCGQEKACSAWLAENDDPAEAPAYCRNHDLFERIKREVEAERGLQLAS